MLKVASWLRLEAKPGQEAAVAQFLVDSLRLANRESKTPVWFAMRLGPSTFAIFDAFADEADRTVHLAGRMTAGLMRRAPALLATVPEIEHADLLAAKFPSRRTTN